MSPKPKFDTIGDEPIEAQIVAWVLGDASAFEAAELERLCQERPELLVFRRRMSFLHDLLTEAESAVPDHATKLPPAKRMALDELLGTAPPGILLDNESLLELRREARVRNGWRQRLLAIAAILILMAMLGGGALFSMKGIGESKQAAAERESLPAVRGRIQLKTDFPPELIEGTPRPIILNGGSSTAAEALPDQSLAMREDGRAGDAFTELPDPPTGAARSSRTIVPSTGPIPLRVEGAISHYSIPEKKDTFDELAPLTSLPAGGLGGAGAGHGFGGGTGLAANQAKDVGVTENALLGPRAPATAPSAAAPAATPPPARAPMQLAGGARGGLDRDARDDTYLFEGRTEEATKEKPADQWKGVVGAEVAGQTADFANTLDRLQLADAKDGQKQQAPGKPASDVAADAGAGMTKYREGLGWWGDHENRQGDKVEIEGYVNHGAPINSPQAQNGSALAAVKSGAGDLTITRNSFDAILNEGSDRGRVGEEMPLSGEKAAARQAEGVPTFDKIPLIGKLANNEDVDRSGQAVKRELAEGTPAENAERKVASAQQLRREGRADDARALLQDALTADPNNAAANRELGDLDNPIRTGAAQSTPQIKTVDDIRRSLYLAEGSYNLGKYDAAKEVYEKVLRADPYNSAARSGMERIASAKADYYRAAYDQSRSELLAEGDRALELQNSKDAPKAKESKPTAEIIREFDAKSKVATPAPPVATGAVVAAEPNASQAAPATPSTPKPGTQDAQAARAPAEEEEVRLSRVKTDADGTNASAGTLESNKGEAANQTAEGAKSTRLSNLAQKEMVRRKNVVTDADRILTDARDAYAGSHYPQAYEKFVKALALLPDAPATKERRDAVRKSLGEVAVALSNEAAAAGKRDESKNWLGKALEFDPENQQARQLLVVDVGSETAAADAPYSTFSLSISDASFKMARAALARGERPAPSSVKIEQFYNAVDYGDPAPGGNEPVAARVEQAAHPVLPGRNLVRVAMRTGSSGRNATQPLRLTLLVDQSGSMAREDRRTAMDNALKQLGSLLTKNDLVTVIGFSRTPRLLADALPGDQGAKLNALVNQAASEGGTNMEEAIKLGVQMAVRHQAANAQNRIVLFTDGAANLGNADPSRLADRVTELRQRGLAFDIAGIGTSNLNDQLLGELARHGNGRYCVVGAEKDADGSFARQLAGAFRPAAENVKVQVRFNPQRVGRYKLLGFEEHRLNTEDFRNDAVDAAELAAEEAGVALYQVEPLATGSGEIGEVSVRFRDAASGQMVERTWTIPYEAATPAFDQAAPSLQLAGLAMLAAEKLRGGPLAEAIDFKQLGKVRATVKQHYANSRRVAEMLEVVNRL